MDTRHSPSSPYRPKGHPPEQRISGDQQYPTAMVPPDAPPPTAASGRLQVESPHRPSNQSPAHGAPKNSEVTPKPTTLEQQLPSPPPSPQVRRRSSSSRGQHQHRELSPAPQHQHPGLSPVPQYQQQPRLSLSSQHRQAASALQHQKLELSPAPQPALQSPAPRPAPQPEKPRTQILPSSRQVHQKRSRELSEMGQPSESSAPPLPSSSQIPQPSESMAPQSKPVLLLEQPSSSLQVHQKRPLGHSELGQSKRQKISHCIEFMPISDFLKLPDHSLIELFEFQAGSSTEPFGVGSIDPPNTVDKTVIGRLVADGIVQAITSAHCEGYSFGGEIEESNVLVAENGPLLVRIYQDPLELATDWNMYLDFFWVRNWFEANYKDADGRMPAYLEDFMDRVDDMMRGSNEEKFAKHWVLRNHPFLMESTKWRALIDDYYLFYKNVDDKAKRNQLIQDMDYNTCKKWHVCRVPKDDFLSLVYWKGREDKIPATFYTRDCGDDELEDEQYSSYPFTSPDGFLAAYHRQFYVHGPDNAREKNKEVRFSLREQEMIIAHYFGDFLPGFLFGIFLDSSRFKLLEEIIGRYTSRKSVAWPVFKTMPLYTDRI